ncbi:GlsB/YeaQ/YmgE family stress response membrane protein [Micromonospora zhanjiangensis]|uniref:GlsB/YeaQ/YmgE family stress response membrane protein n=1 Tax=Micromonospora zhanjiangensis TaxID=1522057 RepID=A0ABV8KMW3_9ACTN
MTKRSGTTADPPAEPVGGATRATRPVPAPGAALLAVLALIWLATMLWSARTAIFSNAGTLSITMSAYALPALVGPSLVAGVAASLLTANLLARRGIGRPTPRFAAAIGVGLVTGVLAALVVKLTYGGGAAVTILAGTIAAAVIIGSALGVLRPSVVGAALLASLAVSAVTFTLAYFKTDLTTLYGSGDTIESQAGALRWFSWTASLASGLVAGLLAFGYLRRTGRRAELVDPDRPPLRWPAYLAAGAGAGLLLLVAEVLIRTAGSRVLALAGSISAADRDAQGLLGGSRVNHALVVLFVGALTALIAFGRTLGPAAEDAGPDDEAIEPGKPAESSEPVTR